MSSYNQAWLQLIASHVDLSQPVNRLTSAQIKAVGKEPRLMTKFDSRSSRPTVLKDNGLFLLPETNGSYLLLREDGYCDLGSAASQDIEDYQAHFPIHFEALENSSSEMNNLDRLFLCGLIGEFVGTPALWATIRGRRFAPEFRYRVGELGEFCAKGIQYEVDQGYESADEIILFEAKGTTPSDFLIRQLFFPFKVFSQTCRKRIRSVFFNFDATHSVCSFFEYRFEDPRQYQSISRIAERHFRVRFPDPSLLTLDELFRQRRRESSQEAWEIPQADDFSKIMELPLKIAEGYDDSGLMATAFDFDARQSSYYRKACEQMGLVTSHLGRYILTEQGRDYIALPSEERTRFMMKMMLAQPIVEAAFDDALRHPNHLISLQNISARIEKESHLSGETVRRRAQSVRSWLRWLENALGELRLGGEVLKID
ncbi:MAG: hypothetical protein KY445_08095 [Armatimonadetes bacterium]|nr:hypothetical protein [Armatimonadota bacterium]